jgi:ABC-2 type transport system permease protein
MFPLTGLPDWMGVLVHLDPLTYGVDALRGVTMGHMDRPLLIDVAVLAGFGALMLSLAVRAFNREG